MNYPDDADPTGRLLGLSRLRLNGFGLFLEVLSTALLDGTLHHIVYTT